MTLQIKTFNGNGVILEPFSSCHLTGLSSVIRKCEMWKIQETIIPRPEEIKTYLQQAEEGFRRSEEIVYVIIDTTNHQIAGCTRFRNINFKDKKAVIGPTFIGVDFQRSHVNTEAKYLMLHHAFETWNLNRVELYCDVLNIRSRKAIKRLGAKEEGIIRNDKVMPNGRIRDSVMHSIISEDWLEVKSNLELLREQYNFLLSA